VGALRLIPKKLLRLYVHSYQAGLFNELVEYCIEHKLRYERLPLIGFGTEPKGKIKVLVDKLMKREKLSYRDFIIRELPDLSSEGTERVLHVDVKQLKIDGLEEDELFLRKKKCVVEFTLPKGAYATEAVKQMMQKI